MSELIQVGNVQRYHLKSGKAKYQIEIAHLGLNKHKLIKGDFEEVVRRKASVQLKDWEEAWERKERVRLEREHKEAKQELADERTREAQGELDALARTLRQTLSVDDSIDWDSLKDHSNFEEDKPLPVRMPDPPREPRRDDMELKPRIGLFHKLIPSLKRREMDRAEDLYRLSHETWKTAFAEYSAEVVRRKHEHSKRIEEWEVRKESFEREQQEANESIEQEKLRYLSGDDGAVVEYCELVLSRSQYPDSFPQEFELSLNPETGLLVVEYLLPAPKDLPTLKEVRYIKSRDEMQEKHISDRELNKLYDDLLYQIALRTIHELFEADKVNALQAVVFNGIVDTIDQSTGQPVQACILSVQAGREEFLKVNLANVDPKKCFKALKGVGSSKLHSITPVAPVVKLDKEDSRFVEAWEVTGTLDDSVNLAAIGWEEFEHLIRELFQQEFAQGGGEVKVTHASRDGGVDAIAFDPDPIRGGKIVIQAKRYTNTVSVSAVRDLYGTVMNEGAIKGVLVTTSDYGPDAYAFAKDKPLTLLNGSNLLHLLGQHGHKAKIDIKEARRLAAET